MELVQIHSTEDLKKVLFLQKTITSRAKNELLDIANDHILGDSELELDDEQVDDIMEAEGELLEKYANYPTLTEFKLMPHLADGVKWGATFGVTLLVGELIFEQLKAAHPHFTPVIKQLVMLFFEELDNPKHTYLVEPLEKHLKLKVVAVEGGKEVSKMQQQAFIKEIIGNFVDTLVALCNEFGIIEVKPGGVAMTSLGKRVLLHLIDATKFIDEMTTAHTKFQLAKPKFSMT